MKKNHCSNAAYLNCPLKGGGWHAQNDNALDPYNGASLLEGARGGEPCNLNKEIGIRGQGGFGGGGGGCRTGGKPTYLTHVLQIFFRKLCNHSMGNESIWFLKNT